MELIRPFRKLNKSDANIAGGKGASLGEMLQSGIPVPDGFVVLSTTFDQFIKDADLTQELEAILGKVDHKEMHTVENASEKIQGLIKNAIMPENIALEIKKQFKNLDTEYVAVRSSATAEDGQDHAWAGQLDSFLNTTEKDLLEKVQHCWASLFTPRAIFYRFEKGLYTTQISVAVVVQKMINSEFSGIAFSVHPVTQDRNQIIVEAGFGLGEAIVSGSVTPDSYVIEKEPRKIIDINISNQQRGLYRVKNGGNEWLDIKEPKASSQVLNEKQILELSDIILNIENHYGFPCDIEWAYENNKFYIVQSRPITTLNSKVIIDNLDDSNHKIIKGLRDLKWEKWLERPFNAFILSLFEDSTRKESFEKIGVPGVELKAQLFQNGSFYINHEKLEEMDAEVEKYLNTHTMMDITDFLCKFEKESVEKISILLKSKLSLEDKFSEIFHILKLCCTYIWLAHGIESFYNRKLKEEVPKYIKEDTDKFIGDASLPKKKNAHFYLEEALRNGTPAEEIVEKFGWIKARGDFSDGYTISEIEGMRNSITQAKTHTEVKIPKELVELFNQIQELVFFRTERTDVFYRLQFLSRPILKEIAEKHGINFADIRYYRAKSFIVGKAEKYIPLVGFGYLNGTAIFINEPIVKDTEKTGDKEISGVVAFKGKVSGIVKIVKEVSEIEKVKVGDIMVTQMTFPSFIPAMIKASAFVTDEGGITCHAAIVAREMQKPCIIGTKNATKILKDGDLVEVDAYNGIVKVLR